MGGPALGLAVDGPGRLLVCGYETGYLFCYDTASGALVDRVRVPVEETLLNDVCVAGGYAYITDSKRPVLWRVQVGERVGEPEEWIDLGEAELTPYLNGIVEVHDGATLLVAAQGTEVLWRVDVASKTAEKVDLGGLRLAADGMVVVNGLLYTCDNIEGADGAVRFFLSALRLTADARAGELVGSWERPVTDTPTTVAHLGGRFYVVNSQFFADRAGTAAAPFTVSALTV
jgi:Cu-Zn family superoxide dismutase